MCGVGCGLAMNISSSLIGTSRVDSFSQVQRSRHFGSLKGRGTKLKRGVF